MASLLTVHEAAERLRVSFWTLYRLTRTGQLASVRVGRRRLIAEDDLAAFVREARHDRPPSDEPAGKRGNGSLRRRA